MQRRRFIETELESGRVEIKLTDKVGSAPGPRPPQVSSVTEAVTGRVKLMEKNVEFHLCSDAATLGPKQQHESNINSIPRLF